MEEYNQHTGKLFLKLYDNGLDIQRVSLENFPISNVIPSLDNRNEWQPDELFLESLMTWLHREGIIYMDSRRILHPIGFRVYEQVQLTAAVIEKIEIPKIEEISKKYSRPNQRSKFYTNVGELVGAAAASFTKVISSQ